MSSICAPVYWIWNETLIEVKVPFLAVILRVFASMRFLHGLYFWRAKLIGIGIVLFEYNSTTLTYSYLEADAANLLALHIVWLAHSCLFASDKHRQGDISIHLQPFFCQPGEHMFNIHPPFYSILLVIKSSGGISGFLAAGAMFTSSFIRTMCLWFGDWANNRHDQIRFWFNYC